MAATLPERQEGPEGVLVLGKEVVLSKEGAMALCSPFPGPGPIPGSESRTKSTLSLQDKLLTFLPSIAQKPLQSLNPAGVLQPGADA